MIYCRRTETMKEAEYQQYLEHFSKKISPKIEQYTIDDILKHSRYVFYHRQGKEQFGYCTHCKTGFTTKGLKHNKKIECPNCKSNCFAKSDRLGRSRLIDRAYFVYYEKSIKNPEIIVARGFYVNRDYTTNDYRETETLYSIEALYIFEMGNSAMIAKYYSWYKGVGGTWKKVDNIYSLFSEYNAIRQGIVVKCHLDSIKEAVKDTPFQYSTYENYSDGDMVKFFDLYTKYPCIEYLTKIGMKNLVEAKLFNRGTYGAINWRGKSLLKVLKLSKQDFKEIKTSGIMINPLFLRLLQMSIKDGSGFNFKEIANIEKTYGNSFQSLQKVIKYTTLRKADSYIDKHYEQMKKSHSHYGKTQAITTWKDYIAECEELMMDLSDGRILFPKNLLEAHQETSKRIKSDGNKIMDMKIETRLKSLNKQYYFEYQGLLIRPASSTSELIREGKELSICVGTYSNGYMTKYSKGQTNLLLIRKLSDPDKPYYTMELCKDVILQTQGLKHCGPDKDVAEFIKAFTEQKLTKKKEKLAVAV